MVDFFKALLACQLLFAFNAPAQVSVRFKLDPGKLSATDSYYLAGNINQWNPANAGYRFVDSVLKITAEPGDLVEFKITRGSWETVECTSSGADIANRVLKINGDTSISLFIADWKDNFKPAEKKHTASENVFLLDSAFYIPQLDRTRAVRIYLPPDYSESSKRYPVLYMSDGQNCFDEYTAGFGEWHIDETLDHFFDSCKKSMIVVAVDHGGSHRLQEYDPYDFPRFGNGEGKAYTRFIVETLKPHIDSLYRTKKDKRSTHIAGSSMGGVISMWAIIEYPGVFGNAGIFSPAFWTAKAIYEDTEKKLLLLKDHSFFLYAGGKESESMVPDTKLMYRTLTQVKILKARLYIDELATHNEQAWSKWFPVYLKGILR